MVIPLVGLTLFLLMAKNIFEKDKIAYVFDSTLSGSKTRAARVSSEVTSVISIAQAIVLNYRSDTKNLAEAGTYFFDRENKFESLQIHAWNPQTSAYAANVDLAKPNGKRILAGKDKALKELLAAARLHPVVIRSIDSSSDRLLLAARFGDATDPKHVIAIALFEASELAEIFSESGRETAFLARKENGMALLSPSQEGSEWAPEAVWAELESEKTPEGIEELTLSSGKHYLASFAEVGVADLVVVSMVEKKAALAAVGVLLHKSVLFFIALIGVTMILAVFASRGMTVALTQLSLAAQKIASGQFDARVEIGSGDEIGSLGQSFNVMAGEISRLIQATAEQARMESELATARTVQETLFPAATATLGPVEIAGHYQPASECGGDWYFYCENAEKVYIWIGDATGHGAPAALLTSAARAVASVISMAPPMAVADCMSILNRAIYDTSKGRMMMTFFIASIDKVTGEMSYSNASHEAPLVVHKSGEEPKRDDFIPLIEVNNPRIGEQPEHIFKEAKIQLLPGDSVIFYTDGVTELKNSEERAWGERRLLKAIGSQVGQGADVRTMVEGALSSLNEFRQQQPLEDDVTLVICQYQARAADTQSQGAA